MKKTIKEIAPMGNKARVAILAAVDKEDKAFHSQQEKMQDTMDTIDVQLGAPEKATGYVHAVHRAMVEGGRDVPAKYSEAIADKGRCGKFLKRLYDFIRNNADAPEVKDFNAESYCKAVLKKCMEHPEVLAALAKTLPAMYAEVLAEATKAAKPATKAPRKAAPKKAEVSGYLKSHSAVMGATAKTANA